MMENRAETNCQFDEQAWQPLIRLRAPIQILGFIMPVKKTIDETRKGFMNLVWRDYTRQ